MVYVVITENDESSWGDVTGCIYHFPKRYEKYIREGVTVVYYKGKNKKKEFVAKRLSSSPHYFGIAKIGKIIPDGKSKKGDLFATIDDYLSFRKPVLAKTASGYLEKIPASKQSNYWRDGVRPINKAIYQEICSQLDDDDIAPVEDVAEIDSSENESLSFESQQEGTKKLKYVTYYERQHKLRVQAVAIHGCTCAACGFNFFDFYGEYAKNFIHIHHTVPVSELGGEMLVNPKSDLVPLCANCHAVVHRKKDKTLSLSELKELINAAAKNR